MQHKNIWTSKEDDKFIQTKLKRKSDGKDCDDQNLNNELEMKEKSPKLLLY